MDRLAEGKRYCAGLADSTEERTAAYRLRHRVFREELGRLGGAVRGDGESDPFDAGCEQLLVVDCADGETVGCYRLLRGATVRPGGFYSEREFAFRGLDAIAAGAVELGRSCVDARHRNGAVIALLWAGLAALRRRWRFRRLFGCVSFGPEDGPTAWRCWRAAGLAHRLDPVVSAAPRPEFACPAPDTPVMPDTPDDRALPPLYKGYRRLGARLTGPPARDLEFGSVDLPVLLDFELLPEKYARHFRTEIGE